MAHSRSNKSVLRPPRMYTYMVVFVPFGEAGFRWKPPCMPCTRCKANACRNEHADPDRMQSGMSPPRAGGCARHRASLSILAPCEQSFGVASLLRSWIPGASACMPIANARGALHSYRFSGGLSGLLKSIACFWSQARRGDTRDV
jgi:hypothetical protein